MTKIYAVFLFSGLLCIFGCNQQNKISSPQQTEPKASLKQASFPAFLVGTWKVQDPTGQYKWEFTFEEDGTISALRNFLDMYMKASEGGAYEQPADANVDFACTLGPVDVSFDPNGRILTVKVVTDYFMLHAYDQILEGNSVDKIFGPVSEDGSTWTTEWQSLAQLVDVPPVDPNSPSINPVIFYKVKEEESNQPSKGD